MKNNSFRNRAAVFFVVLLLLAFAAPVFAQTDTSSLSGTVTDASGALVPDAKVTVRNTATLAERSIATNSSGDFTMPNLPPGDYRLEATASGFKKFLQSGISLEAKPL